MQRKRMIELKREKISKARVLEAAQYALEQYSKYGYVTEEDCVKAEEVLRLLLHDLGIVYLQQIFSLKEDR